MADYATDPIGNLLLEPLAARVRWQLPMEVPMSDWVVLLRAFLDMLALRCANGPYVIGHIKALATLSTGGFVRGSTVSAAYPADVVVAEALPTARASFDITLNLIVYGLPFDRARVVAMQSAQEVVATHGGTVAVEALSERAYPPTHHHHEHGHPEGDEELHA